MKTQQKYIEKTVAFIAQKTRISNSKDAIKEIAKFLGDLLGISYVLINSYSIKTPEITETIAIYTKEGFLPDMSYELAHTPCGNVINKNLCVYKNNIQTLFPEDDLLVQMNVDSYLGIPLWSSTGDPIGLITIMDSKPLKNEDLKTFEIVLQIAAIEIAKILEKSLYENVVESQIKELKEATKKIKESEINFRTLSDLTFEGILIHDNCVAIDVNLSFEKMFGYNKEQLIGKNVVGLLFPKKYHKQLSKSVTKKYSLPYQVEGIRKDGSIFPIEIEAREIGSTEDNSYRVSAMRDISKRKKLEAETKKLLAAVEQSANTIVITDIEGNIEYTNPKFTALTGYTAEEVLGKNPRILNSRTQSKEYYTQMWETITKGEIWKGEFRNKAKNGNLFWEQVTITPLKNDDGETVNYLAIKEDITERRNAKEKLMIAYEAIKESEESLSTILKTASEGFWIANEKRITLEVNPKMCAILGRTENEIVGKSIFDFVDEKNAKIFRSQHKKRELGLSTTYEIELLLKDGKKVPCLFKTSPVFNEDNIITGSFAMVTDISILKKSYKDLEIQNEELKHLSDALSEKNRMHLESNYRFRGLFEQSPVALFEEDYSKTIELLVAKKKEVKNLETYLDENIDFVKECISKIKIINVNQSVLDLFGLISKNEVLTHLRKTLNSKAIEALKKELLAVISDKNEFSYETKFIKKDGTEISTIIKLAKIDEEGKVIVSLTDLTPLKKTKKRLLERERSLLNSQRIANVGSYTLDVTSGVWESTPILDDIFGIETAYNRDMEGWVKIIHPDDQVMMGDYFENVVLKQKKAFNKEYRIVKINDQQVCWVHGLGELEFDHKGNPVSMEGTIQDITIRKQINQELHTAKEEAEESDERYALATTATNIGIWDWDVAKNSIYLSKVWKSQIGYKENELEDTFITWQAHLHPDEYDEKNLAIENYLKNPKGRYISEFRFRHKNGSYIWILARAEAITNKKGEVVRMFGSHADITNLKIAEQNLKNQYKELLKAKEKAEESDRLKTEFLNNMSHEIRTPMNGILGFSEMLGNKSLTKNKRDNFVQIIQSSGHQLLNVIDDILEISRLGTKQIKVNESEVCLNDVFLELFSIFDIKAKENKTPLYLKKSLSDEQSTVFTDKLKLNKVISNLLENALKFTHEGNVEFGYRLKIDSSPAELEIYVKDTGIGIEKAKHNLIFERFSQAEKDLSKKVGGLGLGLSIAKENVELLGGNIRLVSKKGAGATFFVTIPYKPVFKDDDIIKEGGTILHKHTILIVEDEEVNFLYLEALLKDVIGLDCEIIHAKNGQEAVEICKENSTIDMVLMDLKMPVMNGYEATKQLKELYPGLPIVAQTAYSSGIEKEKAALSGCDDFISKPIRKKTMCEMLEKYLVKK